MSKTTITIEMNDKMRLALDEIKERYEVLSDQEAIKALLFSGAGAPGHLLKQIDFLTDQVTALVAKYDSQFSEIPEFEELGPGHARLNA